MRLWYNNITLKLCILPTYDSVFCISSTLAPAAELVGVDKDALIRFSQDRPPNGRKGTANRILYRSGHPEDRGGEGRGDQACDSVVDFKYYTIRSIPLAWRTAPTIPFFLRRRGWSWICALTLRRVLSGVSAARRPWVCIICYIDLCMYVCKYVYVCMYVCHNLYVCAHVSTYYICMHVSRRHSLYV